MKACEFFRTMRDVGIELCGQPATHLGGGPCRIEDKDLIPLCPRHAVGWVKLDRGVATRIEAAS